MTPVRAADNVIHDSCEAQVEVLLLTQLNDFQDLYIRVPRGDNYSVSHTTFFLNLLKEFCLKVRRKDGDC